MRAKGNGGVPHTAPSVPTMTEVAGSRNTTTKLESLNHGPQAEKESQDQIQ